MKKLFLFATTLLLQLSCSTENQLIEESDSRDSNSVQEVVSTLLADYQIPEEDIYYLQKLGFAGSSAQVFENLDLTSNETFITYLLEGDIEFKAAELTSHFPVEALEKGGGLTSQYRTTLIADPETYTVFYEPDGSLTSQAVDLAIENYNNLNLGISFDRIGDGNTHGEVRRRQIGWYDLYSDIVIKTANLGGAGGVAGFPFRKRLNRSWTNAPYQDIRIDPDTEDDGLDVLEHVITHELGHCIGLRHTDFFNRDLSFCPRFDPNGNPINPNEGQAGVGAIHIPGTPAMVNTDLNSVMKACFGDDETGEFTNFDIIALQELW